VIKSLNFPLKNSQGDSAMPIEIQYLDEGRGVLWKASGTLTGEDLLAANKEMFSRDISAEPYHYGLFDSTDIAHVKIAPEIMRQNARDDVLEARRMPNFVYAIYAASEVAFGFARMWEALVSESGWATHTFRSRSEAIDWLLAQVSSRFGYRISIH
jgi:hypothetical protein